MSGPFHITADASSRRTSSTGSDSRGAPERAAMAGQPAAKVPRKETPSLKVHQRPRLASGAALQRQQLGALCRKNIIIRSRAWKTNLLIVVQAVLFIFLIWAVDKAVSASRQRQPSFSRRETAEVAAVGPVPDCADSRFMRAGQPCYTFLYAPAGEPSVEAVVRGVRERNRPRIPAEHAMGLANASAIDAYLLSHPDTVLAAVIFTPENTTTSSASGRISSPRSSSPATLASGSAVGIMPGSAGATSFGPGTGMPAEMLAGSGSNSANGSAVRAALLSTGTGAVGQGSASLEGQLARAQRPRQLGFAIQTNSSVQWFKGTYQHPNTYIQLPLQVAVEREVVRYLAGDASLSWSVGLAAFPHPSVKSPSLIGQFAPTFLFASIMFQFVLLVHDVVSEKEGRVRQAMATMGLRPLPFWASWAIFQGLLALLEACLLVAFGYAFGFKLFTRNAFGLSFLLLLMVCLATTAFGFLVASCLQKASAAVPAGFLLFVVAWVVLILVAGGIPYSPSYSTAIVAVFSTMPWSLLAKGVQDLAAATEGYNPTGIAWADRYNYCQRGTTLPTTVHLAGGYWKEECVVPLGDMYWILAVQTAGFMALAIYLDAILPDAHGVRRAPWFFLLPGYWRRVSGRGGLKAAARALAAPSEEGAGLTVDPDVAEEALSQRQRCAAYLSRAGVAPPAGFKPLPAQEAVLSGGDYGVEGIAAAHKAAGDGGDDVAVAELAGDELSQGERPFAIEMFGLRKVYKRGGLLRRRKPFVAVRGNWLGVHQGECFCLLGPNGAGKSTTINCLTGVLPFDGGDALVCGTSLAEAGGMDRVRPLMGVCPQFDVLWEQLTGREHLMLFGAIKGLPASERQGEAARLLEDVRLSEAVGVRAGAYSGGMRRRLSVAIALLGDPQVVYLDEPTTGLDPISRRHLWDLVDREKRGRAIILTTHSMEEADILGDRIAIMARGRLRCLGTSLRLKARFGSGYRVSVRVQGASGAAGGDEQQGGGSVGSFGSGTSRHNPLFAAAAMPHEAGEIQPDSPQQQQQQQQQQQGGALRRGGSSGGGGGQEPQQRDPVAARQAAAVRALFLSQLGVKPSDESPDYLHFLVRYEHEDRLPALFTHFKAHQAALGVADVQLRLTPLEEVFLTVARKAELEHAQAEGRLESLALLEEGITVQVPLGADFIQSPAGALYHIRWGQDPDTGELRLRSYWQDPASASALELPAGQADGDGEGDDDASVCDGEEAEGEEEEGEQASLP